MLLPPTSLFHPQQGHRVGPPGTTQGLSRSKWAGGAEAHPDTRLGSSAERCCADAAGAATSDISKETINKGVFHECYSFSDVNKSFKNVKL